MSYVFPAVLVVLLVAVGRSVGQVLPARLRSPIGDILLVICLGFFLLWALGGRNVTAQDKQKYIFGAVVLGVVGVGVLTVRKKKEDGNPTLAASAPATTKKCKFCAETIQAEAIVCRFCNRPVEAIET